MAKAKVKEVIERDGREIAIYDSGLELDKETGKIVKPAPHTVLTPERATLLHRQRQQKAARLLREAIVTETMDKLDVPQHGAAASVAAAGGILWREIVLSEQAYPRDRLEAWEKLGKYADVLPADMRRGDDQPMQQATELTDAITGLIRAISEATQRTQPDIVDVDNYTNGDSD